MLAGQKMLGNYLASTLIILTIPWSVHSTPEKPDCDWVPVGEVTRIRDLSDCSKFYYCINGQAPYRASCPTNKQLYLLFEPNSTHCDHWWKAPKDCLKGRGVVNSDSYETTITTTEASTTTTKPPLLNDKFDFKIDCSQKVCGLFPNSNGPCDTYVICVNGVKTVKKCNGGQLFDVKTKECQPATQATCWTEPNAGPYKKSKSREECPFHGHVTTKPIQTVSNGIILQNPVVTNWGSWQRWVECPVGMYATGIYAWRRLLKQGTQMDHAGIVSLSFICQSPGQSETNKIIESLAPGLPHDGWPMYYMCKGAVVGIRLNSVRLNGWGHDQLATDNVQAMCSCSAPVYKPYEQAKYAPQNGNRGEWTTPQYCKKGQAVCGMQTQMQDYKERLLGSYDNNGLNNLKVKCCDVPDPLDECVPKEDFLFVRDCDNSKSDEGLRCDFDPVVGAYIDNNSNQKLVDFYSSIGYNLKDRMANVSSRIESKFSLQIQSGASLQYPWNDIVPSLMINNMNVTSKSMFVKPFEKLTLYQLVGRCGYFLVRTNRYMREIKVGSAGNIKHHTYFDI